MKKISDEKMAMTTGGGKFWNTIWQCERMAVNCRCRKVYHRLWGKSYGAWSYNAPCGYDGTKA
jgi:hypothetical protein